MVGLNRLFTGCTIRILTHGQRGLVAKIAGGGGAEQPSLTESQQYLCHISQSVTQSLIVPTYNTPGSHTLPKVPANLILLPFLFATNSGRAAHAAPPAGAAQPRGTRPPASGRSPAGSRALPGAPARDRFAAPAPPGNFGTWEPAHEHPDSTTPGILTSHPRLAMAIGLDKWLLGLAG